VEKLGGGANGHFKPSGWFGIALEKGVPRGRVRHTTKFPREPKREGRLVKKKSRNSDEVISASNGTVIVENGSRVGLKTGGTTPR